MIRSITIFLLVICSLNNAFSQSGPFARIQVSRSSVYMQEPFRVTITVLTPTWFTAPPVFSNLQIPNAFILPFDQTVPGMFTIKNKKYAGIQFYYIVFPYKEGRFTVPPFPIQVTGPPEGSAVSKKWNLRTREIPFNVKGIPSSVQSAYWLVAKNVSISERWNKSLSNLKTGDVIERTDVINASGTLPQFIPPISYDSTDWASQYPGNPLLKDERTDEDANGTRIQKTTYLLEREGDFAIPEMKVSWWNPQRARMFEKHTRPLKIHVDLNGNLGILKTLKDSLSSKPMSQTTVRPGPQKIAGLPRYIFYMYLLDGLLSVCVMTILILSIIGYIRRKFSKYKSSEQYRFNRFQKSANDPLTLVNNFYKWWDTINTGSRSASVQNTIEKSDKELLMEWKRTQENIFEATADSTNAAALKKDAVAFRQKLLKKDIQNFNPDIQEEWR
jgi:BatD DUF11 like domain